jgi:uncharacterized protein YacL
MGFLRTILIIILIYYLFKIIARYILPMFFANYMDRKMDEYAQMSQRQKQKAAKREGEVTIDYKPRDKEKVKRSEGEYVDYEEIKTTKNNK